MTAFDVGFASPRSHLLAGLHLYKQWRQAADLYQNFVPTAPYAALVQNFPDLNFPSDHLPLTDALAQTLAQILSSSPQAETVLAGQAAFVLDLPGYLSIAISYYLYKIHIAPVALLAGFYKPQAVLNGNYSLTSLQHYGSLLLPVKNPQKGYAFVLERERFPLVADSVLLHYFDNRYYTGLAYFPPPAQLRAHGLSALIDIRSANDELPADLAFYYQQVAVANLDIFQIRLPLNDLPL